MTENNNTIKITIPIIGMHCKSCEMLIEENLKEIKGVDSIRIDYRKGEAELGFDREEPQLDQITSAIEKAGYKIGKQAKIGLINRNIKDYKDLGVALIALIGLYFIVKGLGITSLEIGTASDELTWPLIFLIGLTAGVSTCMALVGGLVLGLSAKHNEKHPEATVLEKFRPHLFFNSGRIFFYALFGGLLGLLGSVFQLSGLALGILTIGVGVVMLIMGLQLTEIFPWINNFKLTLPTGISRILGVGGKPRGYSHVRSMVLGGLTFFLPCGFTQAMQVLAVSTGDFLSGAAVMGLFALGTAPGLLGLGGLTSVVRGGFSRKFFKFAGLAIVAFAIFNISNGLGLAGWSPNLRNKNVVSVIDPNVVLENGVQTVKMSETSRGYEPNSFTIIKGVPVKWVIDAQAPYSCASSLILSKYNIRKSLKAGENIIEFTPAETGKINFSCSMGMYTGVFNVVDKDSGSNNTGS
jgi:uncharacterized protein